MAWTRIDRADLIVGYAGREQQLVDRADLVVAFLGIEDQLVYRLDLMVAYRDPLPDDEEEPEGPPTNARLITAGFARINNTAHRTGPTSYMTAGMTAWNG